MRWKRRTPPWLRCCGEGVSLPHLPPMLGFLSFIFIIIVASLPTKKEHAHRK